MSSDHVYYPDGGATYGLGRAAYVRFRGQEVDKAKVWLLQDLEADSFTAE